MRLSRPSHASTVGCNWNFAEKTLTNWSRPCEKMHLTYIHSHTGWPLIWNLSPHRVHDLCHEAFECMPYAYYLLLLYIPPSPIQRHEKEVAICDHLSDQTVISFLVYQLFRSYLPTPYNIPNISCENPVHLDIWKIFTSR